MRGSSLVNYMSQVFTDVAWIPWLLLMMVYSCVYFAIDTSVVTRALSWFIKDIRCRDILLTRASAYIISIFNTLLELPFLGDVHSVIYSVSNG